MPLPSDRLARLASLIDTMLALPEAEREAWLAALPAEEQDLREHLQALLGEGNAPTGSDAWWQQAPLQARALLERSMNAPAELAAGERIGPWLLLDLLGRGGMGEVWRARRCDGAYQREVALKLPLPAAGPARLAERFARERDILATLLHPNIAAMYDAGLGEQGRPWLALELVDGEPVVAWADRRRLDLRGRVGLALQALRALQYAHNRLVVHRDIKPSNMLVDEAGRLHLLDFGIARLLDAEGGAGPAATPDLTEFGSAALTPTYAAPEQIEKLPLGTSVDLYSLGVVLYELLTGRGPYRPERSGRAALEDAVLHADPVPPGEALGDAAAHARGGTPASLQRALRGDLGNIVLKALRKNPAERYASADAMAQDLQRWLDGLPVQAHPDRAGYRLRKFLRRHRAASAAAALATVAVLAGSGLALWQARVARAEAHRAQAVQAFLVNLFNEAEPARAQGRALSARDLLARGERDLQSGLADEPATAAALRGALVDIYLKLGDPARSEALARQQLQTLGPLQGQRSLPYGQALLALGRAQALHGHYEAALGSLTQAREVLAPHSGSAPDAWFALPTALADTLVNLGRPGEAIPLLGDALPAMDAHYGPQAWPPIAARVMLSNVLIAAPRQAEALAVVRQVEPMLDRLGPALGSEVAGARADIGYALWLGGDWPDARRQLEQAREAFDRLQTPRNSNSIRLQRTLSMLLYDMGLYREAAAVADANAERSREFFGVDDGEAALDRSFRILPLLMIGRAADAEAAARDAVRSASLEKTTLTAAERRGIRRRLALALVHSGQAAEALSLLDEITAEDARSGIGDGRSAASLWYRAVALRAVGRPAEAAEAAAQASALYRKRSSLANQVLAARALLTQAQALAEARQPEPARQRFEEALALLRAHLPAGHVTLRGAELAQAAVLRAEGHAADGDRLERETRLALARDAGIALPAGLPTLP